MFTWKISKNFEIIFGVPVLFKFGIISTVLTHFKIIYGVNPEIVLKWPAREG